VRPPLLYLYNTAIGAQNYGVGSAGAFIVAFLIIAFTFVQLRLFGLGRSYS
jgi:multiple sugar transport system permease protein